jgi:hypothetical protein
MVKINRTKTDNKMIKINRTKTDNKMVKINRTKTDNKMIKINRTKTDFWSFYCLSLSCLFWPFYCLSLSFLFWPFYCLSLFCLFWPFRKLKIQQHELVCGLEGSCPTSDTRWEAGNRRKTDNKMIKIKRTKTFSLYKSEIRLLVLFVCLRNFALFIFFIVF